MKLFCIIAISDNPTDVLKSKDVWFKSANLGLMNPSLAPFLALLPPLTNRWLHSASLRSGETSLMHSP